MVKIKPFTMHRLAATSQTDGQTDRIPKINTSLIGLGKNVENGGCLTHV